MSLFKGPFWIAVDFAGEKVRRIDFSFFRKPPNIREDRRAKEVFLDYLCGSTAKVDWKIFSEKERAVYRAVCNIPWGETRTYGQISKVCGIHPRAVGQILKKNPIPLLIPCHRVVAQSDIGGFSKGVKEKRALLAFERWFLSFLDPRH